MAGDPELVVLGFGRSFEEGVVEPPCDIAGVVEIAAGDGIAPTLVLGVGVLEGVLEEGFTVKEFRALGGTPGVDAAGPRGLKAGRGGAAISFFHSRIVYNVASSMCGSMMI